MHVISALRQSRFELTNLGTAICDRSMPFATLKNNLVLRFAYFVSFIVEFTKTAQKWLNLPLHQPMYGTSGNASSWIE